MVDVVDFRDKWSALKISGLQPEIKSYEDLAKHLHLSGKGAIGNWFPSREEVQRKEVPDEHIDTIIRLYGLERIMPGIDRYIFASWSGEVFRALLSDGMPVWDRLFDLSETAFGRIAMQRVSVLGAETRGVEMDDDKEDMLGEAYMLGERFRIQIQSPAEWWAILLLKDPDGVHCLSPREKLPYQQLGSRDKGLYLPAERSFKITRPLGQHWWLAILTAKKLAPAVCDKLADTLPSFRKEGLADLYNELALYPKDDWRAYRLPFHVVSES